MSDIQDRIHAARKEAEAMKEKIRAHRDEMNDTTLKQFTKDVPALPRTDKLKIRRTLKGHLAKIYAMHWAEDKVHLVSASQDGKLLVWDGFNYQQSPRDSTSIFLGYDLRLFP